MTNTNGPADTNDPTGWAAKVTGAVGAVVALAFLIVGAFRGNGFPPAEELVGAISGAIVALVSLWADLQARRKAIAPTTLVRAVNEGPSAVAVLAAEAAGGVATTGGAPGVTDWGDR